MQNSIGQKIKSLRVYNGLTQEELGKKIGVTKATINKYETGVVINLKRPIIEELAQALCTSPAYLMGWTDNSIIAAENVNNSVIGQNSGSIHINNAMELTKEEKELLRIFNELDVKSRIKLMNMAYKLENANKSSGV